MKYFTIEEMTRSTTATKLGLKNSPDIVAKNRLIALVENTLDPLRAAWGKPLKVNSGYRCKTLNKAVGGASNSSHLYGMAADITAGSKDANRRLWYTLITSNIPFTKVINEKDFTWLHISFDAKNVSKIRLREENGKYYNV